MPYSLRVKYCSDKLAILFCPSSCAPGTSKHDEDKPRKVPSYIGLDVCVDIY